MNFKSFMNREKSNTADNDLTRIKFALKLEPSGATVRTDERQTVALPEL